MTALGAELNINNMKCWSVGPVQPFTVYRASPSDYFRKTERVLETQLKKGKECESLGLFRHEKFGLTADSEVKK